MRAIAKGAAAIAALALLATPAEAAPITYKFKEFDLPTSPGRGVGTVTCGPNKFVYSGGVTADPGSQHIVGSFPVDGPDGDGKKDDAWRVRVDNQATADTATAAAVCGPKQPRYVRRSFTADGVSRTSKTASCPSGRRVVGGGGEFLPPVLDGRVVATTPSANGWRFGVDNDVSESSARVVVVCVKGQFRRVPHEFHANPFVSSSSFSFCSNGEPLVGGGVFLKGGFGDGSISESAPNTIDFWNASIGNFTNSQLDAVVTAICRR